MAFRDPETLICPACGRVGGIVWLVGEGPNTAPGEGPAHVEVFDPGGWRVETAGTKGAWRGRVACPACGKVVREVA